jgi:exodeoxyribonuclease V beta subunit
VALTRARYRLYLPVIPREFPQLDGSYARLNQQLEGLWSEADEHTRRLFASRDIPCPSRTNDPDAARTRATSKARLPPSLLASPEPPPEMVRIRRERAGFAVTSYSTVKRLRAGLEAPDDGAALANEHDAPREAAPGRLPGGAQTGIFVHEILATVPLAALAALPDFSDWYARPEVVSLLGRIRRRYSRPAAHTEPAARLIHAAYATAVRLGAERMGGLSCASGSLRELEFLFPIPEEHHPLLSRVADDTGTRAFTIERGVVKGFIDFLFEHGERFYVCDWKTDDLASFAPADLARHCERHYDVQARIYTLAALRMFGVVNAEEYARRFGGVLFCFLRGRKVDDEDQGIVFLRPSWDEVLSWESGMLEPAFWGMSR